MESRIAVIETDIRYLKEAVAKLFDQMKSMNDAIAKLVTGQAELRGEMNTLRAEMNIVPGEMNTLRAEMKTLRAEVRADISALETKMMRWFIATSFSCAALAFSAAKLLS